MGLKPSYRPLRRNQNAFCLVDVNIGGMYKHYSLKHMHMMTEQVDFIPGNTPVQGRMLR
jgi:hypothetical protein